ncbi:unnamed protein product, partial [Rotaria sp. Silwood1]
QLKISSTLARPLSASNVSSEQQQQQQQQQTPQPIIRPTSASTYSLGKPSQSTICIRIDDDSTFGAFDVLSSSTIHTSFFGC